MGLLGKWCSRSLQLKHLSNESSHWVIDYPQVADQSKPLQSQCLPAAIGKSNEWKT